MLRTPRTRWERISSGLIRMAAPGYRRVVWLRTTLRGGVLTALVPRAALTSVPSGPKPTTAHPPGKKLPLWRCYRQSYDFCSKDNLQWKEDPISTRFAAELLAARPKEVENGLELLELEKSRLVTAFEKTKTLITRISSRGVYQEVLKRMLPDEFGETGVSCGLQRAMVIGHPGIGKSFSLLYALRELLQRKKLVFFHAAKEETLYAFVPPAMQGEEESSVMERADSPASASSGGPEAYKVFRCQSVTSVSGVAQLKNPNTFYLLDPDESCWPEFVGAKSIIAILPDYRRIKGWRNGRGQSFYMPTWTWAEVETLVRSEALPFVDRFPGVRPMEERLKLAKERFHHVGGDLRAIFQTEYYMATLARVASTIQSEKDPVQLVQTILTKWEVVKLGEKERCITLNAKLFAYWSKSPFKLKEMHAEVVSRFVLTMLLRHRYEQLYRDAVEHPTLTGRWKEVCLRALLLGGTFDCFQLADIGNSEAKPVLNLIEFSPCESPRGDQFDDMPGWESDEPEKRVLRGAGLWNDSTSNVRRLNPLWDMKLHRDVVFKCTKIGTPRDKQLPSLDVLADLFAKYRINEKRPLKLYWCVPEEEFAKWQNAVPVRPSTKAGIGEARIEVADRSWAVLGAPLNRLLLQYVIKIPKNLPVVDKAPDLKSIDKS